MMSKHTSPDEVLSSLQKLNLQSRPFDFADEAPGTSSDLLSRPEAADTATPYPEHSTTRAQSSYAMDNSPEYISDATLEQSSAAGHHTAADATDNSPGGEDDVQQMALEDVSVPVNYVSRRTTDPFMEKKLRGLQVSLP